MTAAHKQDENMEMLDLDLWRAHAPRRGSNRKLVNISPVRRPLLLRD